MFIRWSRLQQSVQYLVSHTPGHGRVPTSHKGCYRGRRWDAIHWPKATMRDLPEAHVGRLPPLNGRVMAS
jgi:hypothetical protein